MEDTKKVDALLTVALSLFNPTQMLRSLNTSTEKFVTLIECYSAQPLRGPIDAALKELVKTLLALDDFMSFSLLMQERAQEKSFMVRERTDRLQARRSQSVW